MIVFVTAVAVLAWASLLLKTSRPLTFGLAFTFLALGLIFAVLGGLGLSSDNANARNFSWVLVISGVVTVLSRAGMVVRALFGDDE
jgi:vacuolar-type H+-ATPase subunit I/STV1